jgi:GNAT superfamily N-acetyltransferase
VVAGYRALAVPDIEIRPYDDHADEAAVLELLAVSLGKRLDERYRAFFRWKHHENPFGGSFMWVAEQEGSVVGFRAFMRWRFVDPGGDVVEAVRAVDTATHPDAQGRGIFRRLTLHGLDEMRAEGIAFVFNTPNDQSRPGYLKMGWHVEAQVPMKVRPRSVTALWRMAQARTAAEAESLPVELGEPVAAHVGWVRQQRPEPDRRSLVTDRTEAFVRWRYDGPGVSSRALPVPAGAVVVRFRRRGAAVECTVADVLGSPAPAAAAAAVGAAMRAARADYAIAAARTPVSRMVTAPRLGPIQTRREVSAPVDLPLALTLGDIELF